MIGKYYQLAFEKEIKIEAEAYKWKESIKKALVSDSWRCVAQKKVQSSVFAGTFK